MTLAELMKSISNKDIPHFMVWFGDEQTILDKYLEQISKMGYKTVSCDSIETVLNISNSLFAEKSLYIVNGDKNYQKAESKWESTNNTFNNKENIVIIRYNKVNKNTKFYKNHTCVEFPYLEPDILKGYIKREIDLNDENCNKLIEMCHKNYGRILLEIDKITCYLIMKDCTADEAFIELWKKHILYREIDDITFELTDAVSSRDNKKAMLKLYEANLKGEPAMMISSILYNNFRNMLAYYGLGKNKTNASDRTGLLNWQIRQCQEFKKNYNLKELQHNMLLCQQVESGIKLGTIEESMALEYLVVSCLKGGTG